MCIITYAIQLKNIAGLCYSQPNCVAGSEIPIDTPTPKNCCAGSNDGQSYSDSDRNCVVLQCVGKRSLCIGKTWNACVFEIERPAGEGRDRIRGAQHQGFYGASDPKVPFISKALAFHVLLV